MSYNVDSVKQQIDERLDHALVWCECRKIERDTVADERRQRRAQRRGRGPQRVEGLG